MRQPPRQESGIKTIDLPDTTHMDKVLSKRKEEIILPFIFYQDLVEKVKAVILVDLGELVSFVGQE